MIDWDRPVRTVKSKRQLFVKRRDWKVGHVFLDSDPDSSYLSGVPFADDGYAAYDCPWRQVENFDLLDGIILDPATVATPAEQRAAREFQSAVETERDNPLFGLF